MNYLNNFLKEIEVQPTSEEPFKEFKGFYHWLKYKVKSNYIAELETNHERVINLITKFN